MTSDPAPVDQVEVDVWVRGSQQAKTHRLRSTIANTTDWSDDDVRLLLSEMLLALEREANPGGESPTITLRGFSWIVSPYESGGVIVHLEMQIGTASAGPLAIDERRLTEVIARVMSNANAGQRLH
jgi:hypothetical protein